MSKWQIGSMAVCMVMCGASGFLAGKKYNPPKPYYVIVTLDDHNMKSFVMSCNPAQNYTHGDSITCGDGSEGCGLTRLGDSCESTGKMPCK